MHRLTVTNGYASLYANTDIAGVQTTLPTNADRTGGPDYLIPFHLAIACEKTINTKIFQFLLMMNYSGYLSLNKGKIPQIDISYID